MLKFSNIVIRRMQQCKTMGAWSRNEEGDALKSSAKRMRTDIEPDASSSLKIADHHTTMKRFQELYNSRPIPNSAPDDSGWIHKQDVSGFTGGPVSEVRVSCYTDGLFNVPMQRPVLRRPRTNLTTASNGVSRVHDLTSRYNGQIASARTNFMHQNNAMQERNPIMARECIDLHGKEEYQKLINDHSMRMSFAGSHVTTTCDSSEGSEHFRRKPEVSWSIDEVDPLKRRLDASSSLLSKCVLSNETYRYSNDTYRSMVTKPGAIPSSSMLSQTVSRAYEHHSTPLISNSEKCSTAKITRQINLEHIGSEFPEHLDKESKENQSESVETRKHGDDLTRLKEDGLKTASSVTGTVRSPVISQWHDAVKQSKYAHPSFLSQIERFAKKDDIVRKVEEAETEVKFFKEKRNLQEEQLTKQVRQGLRISKKVPIPLEKSVYELSSESEEEVELVEEADTFVEFPELSEDIEAAVDHALKPYPADQVVAEGFKLQLTRRDISTLAGLNWLNDEVINFYMNLLMERGSRDGFPRVYSFNTFFYPKVMSGGHSSVKRWTKQVDLFGYDFVLIPVHLGVHWCLAVINFLRKEICYYDSMGSRNEKCLQALQKYLQQESEEKKKGPLNVNEWKCYAPSDIPQQMNGSDCGMFACKFAEYVTRNARITFNQSHMPYFRRRMVYEIINKQLM